jgi:Photoprotection regulator fluorescence recovery protein
MIKTLQDDFAIWDLHDYLSKKRREIDSKYDYRYSVLLMVFARLVYEGWLTEDDLSGIGSEKFDIIMRGRSIR